MKIKIYLLLLLISCCGFYVAQAQNFKVTGKLKNSVTGEPISGATVSIKGTKTSTITSPMGAYSIDAPASGSTLVVSYVGMKTVEKVIPSSGILDFTLTPGSSDMGEIVVIGYGTQAKRNVTTAISTIKAKTIESLPVYSLDQALQGTAPGVIVAQTSGSPGAPLTVRVRGTSTVGNTQPLYIVDGMQVPNINYLNSFDIDNVSVLKDAASTAIYGARGGNGVVLLQTKHGRRNMQAPSVTFDGYYGIQNLGHTPDLMNTNQYVDYYNKYAAQNGGTPISDADRQKLPNTNWFNEVFEKNAPIHNAILSLANGGDKYSYYVSGSDFKQTGMVGGKQGKSDYERRNLKFNFEFDPIPSVNINVGANLAQQERNYLFENTAGTGVALMNYIEGLPSIYPAFDSSNSTIPFNMGDLSKPITVNGVNVPAVGAITNPFLSLLITNNRTLYQNQTYHGAITWKPVPGLELSTSYDYYQELATDKKFTPQFDYRPAQNFYNLNASLAETNYTNTFSQWEGNAKYKFKNLGDSKLDVMGGFTVLQSKGSSSSLSGAGFFVNDFKSVNFALMRDPTQIVNAQPQAYETGLLSFYGRANYSYKDKYLLAATLRSDASSLFGQSNRAAVFPSVSAGWVISEESFMNDSKFISMMKLRASWGINGNNFINPYQYSTVVNPNSGPSFGGLNTAGISIPYLANPDVKWEQSQQTDIGLDINLFNNTLGFTIDYYNKKNSGVLIPVGTPVYTGYASAAANVADIKNSGIDLQISYQKKYASSFSWSASANLGYNKNETTGLGEKGQPIPGGSIGFIFPSPITNTYVGHPVASFYGYKVEKVDATGSMIFQDLNKDGKIDNNDKTYIGSGLPDLTYGATIGAEYKGFDFSAFLYGTSGNEIYDATVRLDASYSNRPVSYQGPGAPKNVLGSGGTGTSQTAVSNFYVKDGSFAKLKTLTLGYSLPQSLLSHIHLSQMRVYVTGQNLFVITKYKGIDPEIGQSSSSNTLDVGIDRGFYPQPVMFIFGLQVKF